MATPAENIRVPSGAIGAEQNLATWAGPYITGMLENAQALAGTEFQPYKGALTAGASPLQTQAFQGLGALTIPQNITQAGTGLGQVAQKAGQMGYTPGQFASTYQAPGQFQPGQFTNQFAAPGAYQAATFTPDQYSQQAIQPYMNPYLESVLEPQRREAQRQADIARTQMQGRMAQAGAYGGSRQAIMEAEGQRNLQTLLGDITGKGYAAAFDTAQQQFANEQARRLQAAQFGEASRQFGAGQAMTAAELQARYGLSADQAREASRQFAAQQAAETARTGAQYGLEAQRLGEQSRQFGAGFGLDALSRQMQALQAQGALGATESQVGLANLAAQMQGGAAQRAIEQEGLAADYAQYLRESAFPYEQLKFQQSMLAGLPIGATAYAQPSQDPFDAFIGGAQNLVAAINLLNPSLTTQTPGTASSAVMPETTDTTVPPPPAPATVVPGATNMTPVPGGNVMANTGVTTTTPAATATDLFDYYATGYTPDANALSFWNNKINTLGYEGALNEFLNPAQGSAAPRYTYMSQDPDFLRAGGQRIVDANNAANTSIANLNTSVAAANPTASVFNQPAVLGGTGSFIPSTSGLTDYGIGSLNNRFSFNEAE